MSGCVRGGARAGGAGAGAGAGGESLGAGLPGKACPATPGRGAWGRGGRGGYLLSDVTLHLGEGLVGAKVAAGLALELVQLHLELLDAGLGLAADLQLLLHALRQRGLLLLLLAQVGSQLEQLGEVLPRGTQAGAGG